MHLTTLLSIISLTPLTVSSLRLSHPPSLSLITPANLTLPHPSNDRDYDPQCHRITDPPQPGLSPSNCDIATEILCVQLGYHLPENQDKWIWVEQPGCAVAVWEPHDADQQRYSCPQIFTWIIEKCIYDSRFNAGSVNVLVMPDFAQGGMAWSEQKVRYLVAAERLTL